MNNFTSAMLLACLSFSAPVFSDEKKPPEPDAGIELDTLLTSIQEALVEVQVSAYKDSLPCLSSVDLALTTAFTKKGGGKISLFVFTAGMTANKQEIHQLDLKLTPPNYLAPKSTATEDTLSSSLAAAIITAAKGTALAATRKPKLELSKLVATVKFVIEKGGEAGVKFIISPITIDLGGAATKASTQSIVLTFDGKDRKLCEEI